MRATMTATFHYAIKRNRDLDNLLASTKNQIDGIVAAGLMVNDSGLIPLPSKIVIDKTTGVTFQFTKID